jgi:hypothetical protein
MWQSCLIPPVSSYPYSWARIHRWQVVKPLFAENAVKLSANNQQCSASISGQSFILGSRQYINRAGGDWDVSVP